MADKDDVARYFGFESTEEMRHLISQVNIADAAQFEALENWLFNDRSKDGLLAIIAKFKKPHHFLFSR